MHDRTPRRESPAVNAGSMADIAFLLLIFFLVTTTIANESGVLVKLPPWDPARPPQATPHVLSVVVNARDELLIGQDRARVSELSDRLRAFVHTPGRNPRQAVVSLVHDRSTSYTRYITVYDALLAAYRDLWDEESHRRYAKAYEFLSDAQKQRVRREIPLVLSEAEPNDVEGSRR
ncbi:biopolymer transporter ExbD [Lewinella sp. JB7]|uniref:ExbD/TolR family protein n=1 Tax=Lewinella sp. JB7 TaxID=2962887 RepID=UPI0020C9E3AC|nr:biopolymer transporter ExbD [Lewinella sp. JB7]MCP9236412.1 biopolymer transporter ExbD [Lewinella sp. JB7]